MRSETIQRPRLDEDVIPFTEYRRSLSDWLAKTANTHRPVVITQNGRATSVVMNIADFERTWDEIEMLRERVELSESVEISRHEFEEGKVCGNREVFRAMNEMLRGENGR